MQRSNKGHTLAAYKRRLACLHVYGVQKEMEDKDPVYHRQNTRSPHTQSRDSCQQPTVMPTEPQHRPPKYSLGINN